MESNTEEIIKMAAIAGARAALDTMEKERKKAYKERRDKRLHNTKLLLEHYRLFREHCGNAVFETSQINESAIDILDLMWDPYNKADAVIESIKKSTAKTQLVLAHIDIMFSVFAVVCEKSRKPEDSRQYRVIKSRYIDEEEKTIDEIAELECIDKSTIYRDVKSACETLSCLIFGLDGLQR